MRCFFAPLPENKQKEFEKNRVWMFGFLMDQLHLSYSDICIMPVNRFRDIIKWKIERNKEEQRRLEEQYRELKSKRK